MALGRSALWWAQAAIAAWTASLRKTLLSAAPSGLSQGPQMGAPGQETLRETICNRHIRPLELERARPDIQKPFGAARPASPQWEVLTTASRCTPGGRGASSPASLAKGWRGNTPPPNLRQGEAPQVKKSLRTRGYNQSQGAGPGLGGMGWFRFEGHGGAGITVCLKTFAECNRRKRASMGPPTLHSLGPDALKSVRGSGQRRGGKGLSPAPVRTLRPGVAVGPAERPH